MVRLGPFLPIIVSYHPPVGLEFVCDRMAFTGAAGRLYCQTQSDAAYEPENFAETMQYLKVVLLNP